MISTMFGLPYRKENHLEDIALPLLEYGADPNLEEVFLHPLSLACKHGLEHVVKKLLEKNSRLDLEDGIHQVPILEAIKAPILEREPDDSKEEPDILGNRPHSTK